MKIGCLAAISLLAMSSAAAAELTPEQRASPEGIAARKLARSEFVLQESVRVYAELAIGRGEDTVEKLQSSPRTLSTLRNYANCIVLSDQDAFRLLLEGEANRERSMEATSRSVKFDFHFRMMAAAIDVGKRMLTREYVEPTSLESWSKYLKERRPGLTEHYAELLKLDTPDKEAEYAKWQELCSGYLGVIDQIEKMADDRITGASLDPRTEELLSEYAKTRNQ